MVGLKCEPGCTCARHKTRGGSKKCLPGCTCWHHRLGPDPEWVDRVAPTGSPEYKRRHRVVARELGKASFQNCAAHEERGVIQRAGQWARIHTETGEDPQADYVPLCTLCHDRYDERTSPCSPGCSCGRHKPGNRRRTGSKPCDPGCTCGKHRHRIVSDKTRAKLSESLAGREVSSETRAKQSEAARARIGRECQPGCSCGKHRRKSDAEAP